MSSRARYLIHDDFIGSPPYADVVVPWDWVWFQSGTDFTLQAGGKVLFRTHGLYEFVVSADWQLMTLLDYDLRQIGLRLQRQGQPDEPIDYHERIGFHNTPGSDAPRMARWQGQWGPLDIPPGGTAGIEVQVAPSGTARPGDMALAGHTAINRQQMPLSALRALVVHAKVVALDTVAVSLHNTSASEAIHVGQGTLKVIAMTAQLTHGRSGDAWQLVHSASVEIRRGDRVYAVIRHHVEGTVLQTSDSTWLQIDRLA
jgi:hypothetical protein